MFNHIIAFYWNRRREALRRYRAKISFRNAADRAEAMLHGYIQAARVFNIVGIDFGSDNRVRRWAGVAPICSALDCD